MSFGRLLTHTQVLKKLTHDALTHLEEKVRESEAEKNRLETQLKQAEAHSLSQSVVIKATKNCLEVTQDDLEDSLQRRAGLFHENLALQDENHALKSQLHTQRDVNLGHEDDAECNRDRIRSKL